MPPRKRKAAASAKATAAAAASNKRTPAKRGKKGNNAKAAVDDDDDDDDTVAITATDNATKTAATAAATATTKRRTPKTDENCPVSHTAQVLEDYDCMLNQTNINANNNKFYVIQLLKDKSSDQYYVWTRWGRVGETGQSNLSRLGHDNAIKEFEKKFKDKTKNEWDKRADFVAKPGKYTLLEMDDDDDDEEDNDDNDGKQTTGNDKLKPCIIENEIYKACSLDQPTMELITLLFDDNMFVSSMAAMDLDVKKMPLGKLSKGQIAKGFDCLIAIEEAIKANKSSTVLERLSSAFFTQIPHSFGRQRPPLLNSTYLVQKKKEMLLVLSDIELAQNLQKKDEEAKNIEKIDQSKLKPHPLDEKYRLLQCKLSVLGRSTPEHKVIEKYIENTKRCKWKILHVWKVDREGESERFKAHDKVQNRKLLWHGTNVAVVAAILNSGLRIMPHSGGRVGRGVYFASMHAKSASYVNWANNFVGIMFLNEVALGREHTLLTDDHTLRQAPDGFDSIVARGQMEPDATMDTTIKLDGNDVIVPQGKPIKTEYKDSHFGESEYLIYKESQAKIRYLITFNCR